VNIVKWHSNGNFLVTGSDDRTTRIWDVRVKNSIGKIISDGPVNGLDFSPCGRRLTVSGKSNYISTFDMRTVNILFKIKEKYLKNKIDKISYLNNEDFCYVKDHKIIKLWDFGKKSNLLNPLSIKYSSEFDKIFQLKLKKYNKLTIIGINNN
jgi:WD40 repeat protein